MDDISDKMKEVIGKGGRNKVDLIGGEMMDKDGIERLDGICKKDFKNGDKGEDLVSKKYE
ncbi:ribonuclease H family protein [Staphylococcus haemolyticus]|uniref:hypothetical protein n=1 Tax=Staphylococcus haemolyticus TaxID=1283 RepID=UPI0011A4A77E|nr:hypothetical protein [Staphylococcus haemolyticus]